MEISKDERQRKPRIMGIIKTCMLMQQSIRSTWDHINEDNQVQRFHERTWDYDKTNSYTMKMMMSDDYSDEE